jgi:hypothetical protein
MEPETLEPTLVAHPNLAIFNFLLWKLYHLTLSTPPASSLTPGLTAATDFCLTRIWGFGDIASS